MTSFGREHLEGLGGMEGVVREELSILEHVRDGGLVVLPGSFGNGGGAGGSGCGGVDGGMIDRLVDEIVSKSGVAARGVRVVRFGWGEDCDVRVLGVGHERSGMVVGAAGLLGLSGVIDAGERAGLCAGGWSA